MYVYDFVQRDMDKRRLLACVLTQVSGKEGGKLSVSA